MSNKLKAEIKMKQRLIKVLHADSILEVPEDHCIGHTRLLLFFAFSACAKLVSIQRSKTACCPSIVVNSQP